MLIWSIFGAVAAVAIGWIAAKLNVAGFAPVGILPLGVGVVLGVVLSIVAAIRPVAVGKRLIVGTMLIALLAVAIEHAWLYHDFRRQWQAERTNSPQVAMFRPETPLSAGEYFRRELTPGAAALWGVDAVLVVGAAAVTVILLTPRLISA